MNRITIFIIFFVAMTINLKSQQTANYDWKNLSDHSGGPIKFVSATEGWISRSSGGFYHTTTAGKIWDSVNQYPNDVVFSLGDPAFCMSWVNATHGWKIAAFGTNVDDPSSWYGAIVYKTIDGGKNWDRIVIPTDANEAGVGLQFVDENNGFASISNMKDTNHTGRLIKSNDGGKTWNPIITNGLYGMYFFVDACYGWSTTKDPNNGNQWVITNTTDGGENWYLQYVDIGNKSENGIYSPQFTDQCNGWFGGDQNKLLRTTDGGKNWEKIYISGVDSAKYSRVFFLDSKIGWALNNDQHKIRKRQVFSTLDGGNTWKFNNLPPTDYICDLCFWDKCNGWMTGDSVIYGHYNGQDSINFCTSNYTPACKPPNPPCTSGISKNIISDNLNIYPNPASDYININNTANSKVKAEIYDIMGQTVYSENLYSLNAKINVAKLNEGIYFIKISEKDKSSVQKIIIRH